MGLADVRTYIQSGNAVVRCPTSRGAGLADEVSGAVEARFGFRPRTMVISAAELRAALARNPFPESASHELGKRLHFFFLDGVVPEAALERCEAVRAPTEGLVVDGRVAYLHTPNGFADSKLAARLEKLLGVGATARNWLTVTALAELAGP